MKYNDNGTGVFITNPDDGTVYQKGIIEVRTENGSDTIKTTYESFGVSQYDNKILTGIYFWIMVLCSSMYHRQAEENCRFSIIK
jgi:hypothetical protein